MTTPRIGDTVHYTSHGSTDGTYPATCRAAIITADKAGSDPFTHYVDLCVLNPEGMYFNRDVAADPANGWENYTPGTWHPTH